MTTNMRYGNRWTISELISLQREYELLEWPIQKIAEKHRRSVRAILFKLESEHFISSWNEARGFNLEDYSSKLESSFDSDSECENIIQSHDDFRIYPELNVYNEINGLSQRLSNLETGMEKINLMVKQMFEILVSNKTTNSEIMF